MTLNLEELFQILKIVVNIRKESLKAKVVMDLENKIF